MAWLQTPVQQRRGRSVKRGESRLERLKREGVDQPAMPPIAEGGYLVAHLLEVGPAGTAGMELAAVSFQELQAWLALTAHQLRPWEAGMLRRLSRDYVAETRRAADPQAVAPWRAPLAVDRAQVAKKVGALFGALARKTKRS